MDREQFLTWLNILKRTENSELWLTLHPPDARGFIMNLTSDVLGSNESHRVVLWDRTKDVKDYLARIKSCHVFLDPTKYNSHSTGLDSLWMSVPMITMPSERFASRVGASLISALDCSTTNPTYLVNELVVTSTLDYENKAVSFATDRNKWQQIKDYITDCIPVSHLFNIEEWVTHWEIALTKMVENFQQNKPHEHIVV
jgi:predicted O-linked N-acetylglucosamine transferase (SPINDLY family)